MSLRIPAIHDAQKQLFCTFCSIFFLTRPYFKNLRGVFFDKGSIDVKSVLTSYGRAEIENVIYAPGDIFN